MSNSHARYRVLADYEVLDSHPLRIPEGAEVKVLREDDRWPGWVWVRYASDQGWMPAGFLGPEGGFPLRRCQRPFDGIELSACRGEILTAMETESGWIFARRENGEEGWFPLFNLKPVLRI